MTVALWMPRLGHARGSSHILVACEYIPLLPPTMLITRSASASVSDDGHLLAISNLTTGFDIYNVISSAPVRCLRQRIGQPFPVPVLFVHGGQALLTGSTTGDVRLWSTASGQLHRGFNADGKPIFSVIRCDLLPSAADKKVLTIAAYHHLHPQHTNKDRFVFATGVLDSDGGSGITLWEAHDLGEHHPFAVPAILIPSLQTKRTK